VQSFGRSRDEKILEGIERFRYLTTNQIAELYFPTIKKLDHRVKKTSQRMKRMYDRGYVQRFRFPSEPFIFTVRGNKFSNRIQHYLMIAQVWIVLNKIKPSGSVLNCEVEHNQGEVQTDLYVEYKNNFRQENKIYWIEVENESNADILEKCKKYESLVWRRRIENKVEGQLCIIYLKRSIQSKLESNNFDVPIKAMHFSELEEKWKW
jgi:hypothetical protein